MRMSKTAERASRHCWEMLEAALTREETNPGRDRSIPWREHRLAASHQANRAFQREQRKAKG